MKRIVTSRRAMWTFISCMLALCFLTVFSAVSPAWAAENELQLYPTPHYCVESKGTMILRREATVVLEDGIDSDTEARLNEVLSLAQVKGNKADSIGGKGSTNIMVGVKGSHGAVDQMVEELIASHQLTLNDRDLFKKTDAYLLVTLPAEAGNPDRVIVLGASTDAAFYGLTSLYQIIQQKGTELPRLQIEDHADVITRGFIEGYYGNPWSTQDRVNLMKWGGYYKLNAYVYAPKDDPKHNREWRTLYSEQELNEKIDPLAQAGNESKCRFVYALHPFMNQPITNANYDESVAILKQKFTQVMDHGVRQIAILADDAGNQGQALYTKLLKDMTEWIRQQQKATEQDGSLKYPGLKDTIIFCPVAYYGGGEGWYKNLPDNIQVVNTGGRIWGKIDNAFATRFKNTSGVAPFMWINWPCSDNDKDALHMGGHNNFLGSDVKPGQVKGVVLNPMQQSEPSKQGIFMNADFTWNLWKSQEHANKAWEESFSYVDHNSPVDTAGSNALRELSGHALRMYGGGATWENGESAAIKDKLADFRTKLAADNVTEADVVAMQEVFTGLKNTAETYRANAGNEDMLAQISYWVDAMDEQAEAALLELEAVAADLKGDKSTLVAKYSEGTAKLDEANSHGFNYIDHTEYARIGKAHIIPTINALDTYVAEHAELASNPDADFTKFITSRTDTPTAKTDVLFDGKANTGLSYKDPATITKDTYIGIEKTNAFDLDRFTVTYDSGHPNDTIRTAKLQVLKESNGSRQWVDVEGKTISNNRQVVVDFKDLNQKDVFGVRLIATENNQDACWLTVNEIELNKADEPQAGTIAGTASLTNCVVASGDLSKVVDNNDGTKVALKRNNNGSSDPNRDYMPKGATVTVTFEQPARINHIYYKQTAKTTVDHGDGILKGRVQYLPATAKASDAAAWVDAGSVNGSAVQNFTLDQAVTASAIRVVNDEDTKNWWDVFELRASFSDNAQALVKTATTNMPVYGQNPIEHAIDGNDSTKFWSSRNTQKNDWVMLELGGKVKIDTVHVLQGANDKFSSASLFYTKDENPNAASGSWTKACDLDASVNETKSFKTVEATAVKLVSNSATNGWFQLFEFDVFERYPFTADNIYTSFDMVGNELKARVTTEGAATTDTTVTLPKNGDVVAVDLGSIRRDVSVSSDATKPVNADLVYSMNGLEWKQLGAEAVRARYVGYKAKADGASVPFKSYTVSFLGSLAPKLVSSDVAGSDGFDVSKVFDGNIGTNSTISGCPKAGNKVVFDLGQARDIKTFEYFIPEGSKDFIRNAVIEVSNDPEAADDQWIKVLDINSEQIVEDTYNETTAKDAAWLEHSSEAPGNMTAKAEGLNASGRYLRIRFTGTYSHRWVCLGELRINGGEYVSTYAGGDFESTVGEQRAMLPSNMIDKNLESQWAPAGEVAGTLTYHVSAPLKADGTSYEGIRIISRGNPSGATVKAVLYTNGAYSDTETVTLGTISQNCQEFLFGNQVAPARAAVNYTAVKDILVEWKAGVTPQISELYLLGKAPAATKGDIDALKASLTEAKKADTGSWTESSRLVLERAIASAEVALGNESMITVDAAASLRLGLENAIANKVIRYTGSELSELVAGAIADGSSYTKPSWDAYSQALAAAKDALKDPDNISDAEGKELAQALKTAQDALSFDLTAYTQAVLAVQDGQSIWGQGEYTVESKKAYDDALAELKALVDAGVKDPARLVPAMDKLFAARDALKSPEAPQVNKAALQAKYDEVKSLKADGYTAESWKAFDAARTEAKKVLDNAQATQQQVDAALKALTDAHAGLKKVETPQVDKAALQAKYDEVKDLKAEDYKSAGWRPFDAARTEAKKVLDNAQATQQQVDAALEALTDARAALQPVEKVSFSDVDKGTAHEADIAWLAANGISKGWDNGDGTFSFRPYETVKRCDMAAFLYRLAGSPKVDASKAIGFADVKADTPHRDAILWMAAEGISTGWGEGASREFRPYAEIARCDMAEFLYRMAGSPKADASKAIGFADVDADTPHREAVLWMAAEGISTGWGEGSSREFRPYAQVARCDMAAFLHRMDEKGLVK